MNDPVFPCAPKNTPFVILCYPRTGSYLLVDMLNQFPEIVCHGEIFNEKFVELSPKAKEQVGYSLEERNQDPFGYIRKIFSLDEDKHTGFKLFPSHCKRVFEWAKTSTLIKRIALIRAPFEVYVSLQRAKATGVWVDKWGKATKEAPKLRFDPEEFDGMIRHIRNHNENLQQLAESDTASTMMIRYNQVTQLESLQKIAQFIGTPLKPDKFQIRLHRQTTELYSELFENFDELLAHAQSKYPKLWIDPKRC